MLLRQSPLSKTPPPNLPKDLMGHEGVGVAATTSSLVAHEVLVEKKPVLTVDHNKEHDEHEDGEFTLFVKLLIDVRNL